MCKSLQPDKSFALYSKSDIRKKYNLIFDVRALRVKAND